MSAVISLCFLVWSFCITNCGYGMNDTVPVQVVVKAGDEMLKVRPSAALFSLFFGISVLTVLVISFWTLSFHLNFLSLPATELFCNWSCNSIILCLVCDFPLDCAFNAILQGLKACSVSSSIFLLLHLSGA